MMISSDHGKMITVVGRIDHIGLVDTNGMSIVHGFTLRGRAAKFRCVVSGISLDWHIGLTLPGDRVRFVVEKGRHAVMKSTFVNLEV